MAGSDQEQLAEMLQGEWGLQVPDIISEEAILKALERRVMELADKNPERFFQLMYRLDVSEQKVKAVLFEPDAAMQIARLIYKRQLQKIEARKMFATERKDIDEELKW